MKVSIVEYDTDSFTIYLFLDTVKVGSISVNFNYIATLHVSPEYRDEGNGTLLLSLAENIIEDKGYTSVLLHAEPCDITISREYLRNFYLQRGYATHDQYMYEKALT